MAWASVENSFAPVGFPEVLGGSLAFDAGEDTGLAAGAFVVVGVVGAELGEGVGVAGAAVV